MKYFRLVPSSSVEDIRTFFDSIRNHAFGDRKLNTVCHGPKKRYRLEPFTSPTSTAICKTANKLQWNYFWLEFGIYLVRILKETKTILILTFFL
jgi:hypothetical protein